MTHKAISPDERTKQLEAELDALAYKMSDITGRHPHEVATALVSSLVEHLVLENPDLHVQVRLQIFQRALKMLEDRGVS